ncbi:response regulator [Dinoroseobacter sp. PD6]|uniref:ATP-binding protein n=1 Tax=Dinoroseobacter sp. PD6 TaxID=3028384 RepID=UPI00237B5208|nr:ATP-binding protein [Dinoroseobacter sp. PD6]MDD9716470.1 response regulator [Dinoroseobacter sp. PD6]
MAIIVGLAAIGVNRYLISTKNAFVETTLPATTLASRIGASSELVGALAAAFVQVDTQEDLAQIAETLKLAVDDIEDGMQELAAIAPPEADFPQTSRTRDILERMTVNAGAELQLAARIQQVGEHVALDGARLDALIEAETDLARLRITAGIADLYASPEEDPRPGLDRLADRYFFGFERLTELARLIDAMRIQFQQVPDLNTPEDVQAAHESLARTLVLVQRRMVFLPSPQVALDATSLLQRQQAAIGSEGLTAMALERLALRAGIASDSALLQSTIAELAARARLARDAVQADGAAQIALASQRSSVLVSGLFLAVVSVALVAAMLLVYARRRLIGRLSEISQRIVAVARGDYGNPMPISGHDEIGRMEKALNILRRRAQDEARLRDSLEEAVIARTGDVVAEMRASNAARADAEAANRSKSAFLARMSHEIRTPLNGIIGMLDLLEAETEDPERKARTKTALSSARDLREITNDILTFASGETTADRGNPVHFVLRELVGQMGHHLQSLAAQKGLAAVVDLSESAPVVLYGDAVKIRQILGNLISNAVKYTREGTVTLTVDHAMDERSGQPVLSFTVADTGTGMTSQALARAFDAYARADSARQAGIEGLGLGLAISRSLTEALGGALSVESEAGVGSRFSLTVPLSLGDPEQVAQAGDDWLPGLKMSRDVLVIDDHRVNLMVARGYLEKLGCRVTEAGTGRAALQLCRAQRFDLALIDLDLPDMRGEEVAAELRRREDAPMLVALTAHLAQDTAESRARLGFARILTKPISPRALAEVLEQCVPDTAIRDDMSVIESLRADTEDLGPQVTAAIVREFLDDLPRAVDHLFSSAAEDRRKAAHKLKGAASNFRLDAFCAVLAAVEKADSDLDEELLREVEQRAMEAAESLEAALVATGLQSAAGSTNW